MKTKRQKKKHALLCTGSLKTLEEKNPCNRVEDTENHLNKKKKKHVDSSKNNQEVSKEVSVDSSLPTAEIILRLRKRRKKKNKKRHPPSFVNNLEALEEKIPNNMFGYVDINLKKNNHVISSKKNLEPPMEKTLDSSSQTTEIVQTEKRRKQHQVPSEKSLVLELPENKNINTGLRSEESHGEACVVKKQWLEARSSGSSYPTNTNVPKDEHLNNQLETLEVDSMENKNKKKKKYGSPVEKNLGNLSKSGDCDPIKKQLSAFHENNLDPHEESNVASLFQIVDIDQEEKTEARSFASLENNLNFSKKEDPDTAVQVAEIGAMSMDFASGKVERVKEKLMAQLDSDFNDIMATDNFPQLLVQKKEEELNQLDVAKGESSEISTVSMKEEKCSSLPNNKEVFEEEDSTLVLIDKQANPLEGVLCMPSVGGTIKYTTQRRLLILDVNGLLADVGWFPSASHIQHIKVNGKSVYKRPFCDDFLKFCFGRFDVGIWSSATKHNVEAVVNCLLGDMKSKLLFCWDRSKCTVTQFKTIENRYKPLVLKELKKLWNKDEPDLPWEKGEYTPSNTLLLDDSPYKALMNPPHTAIFPYPYSVEDKNDNTLGPGGELRVYLEGLAMADDIQQYIKEHPFGQLAITSSHPDWNFYFQVSQCQESVGAGLMSAM